MSFNRTTFIIDGFNLYHSVKVARRDLKGQSTKWLNISALCKSYLHIISKDAQLEEIFYFSALATHLSNSNPDATKRHQALIECLQDTGIRVQLAKFKRKYVHCNLCNSTLERYEEKETDVAMAVKLLELLNQDACDTVVLIIGDTDLKPAVETAQDLFPDKEIRFAFPYKRYNAELKQIAPTSFNIGKKNYAKHQLPDPYIDSAGRSISKPHRW